MKTAITELLGIEYPVIQGGMGLGWQKVIWRLRYPLPAVWD